MTDHYGTDKPIAEHKSRAAWFVAIIAAVSRRVAGAEVLRWRSSDDLWIDHATLRDSDTEWLEPVTRLTMYAVNLPEGLLARLPNLQFLDIRGGSGVNLSHLVGCEPLRVLVVNQVRGLSDLGAVSELESLELLSIYGLPRVQVLPSTENLPSLTRINLGSLKGLSSLVPILKAPQLQELDLVRAVNLSPEDVTAIKQHPTLLRFGWFAEDVPDKTWKPVVDAVGKPSPQALRPEDWLDEHPK